MIRRSDLLIHWTGKDICTDLNSLNDTHRRRYLERLRSSIEKGLWLTKNTNENEVPDIDKIRSGSRHVCCAAPFISFTELRASQSVRHISDYGLMGFAFSRIEILRRYGGPVFYVRNHSHDIITKLTLDLYEKAKSHPELRNEAIRFEEVFSYYKGMSRDSKDDFIYIDENEWRIVASKEAKNEGLIIKNENEAPPFYMPFLLKEIEAFILPDRRTLDLISGDKELNETLFENGPRQSILTIQHALEM